jgi:hypothetical protein
VATLRNVDLLIMTLGFCVSMVCIIGGKPSQVLSHFGPAC